MARPSLYGKHKIRVLELINSAAVAHARPPSVRMLSQEVGVGLATMQRYLEKLAEEGLVEWQARSHRSVRCTQMGIQALTSSETLSA